MLALWVGATLILGRGWCSWGCFFGGIEEGFVQLVWQPKSGLPLRIQDSIDLNRDGARDCEIFFSNPAEKKAALFLTVIPKSAWVIPVHNSPTTSLAEILIEKGRDGIFVRIPVRKFRSS
jgi:hypothetical protein